MRQAIATFVLAVLVVGIGSPLIPSGSEPRADAPECAGRLTPQAPGDSQIADDCARPHQPSHRAKSKINPPASRASVAGAPGPATALGRGHDGAASTALQSRQLRRLNDPVRASAQPLRI